MKTTIAILALLLSALLPSAPGAQLTINLGTAPHGTGGDNNRQAFTKVNANFTELYTSYEDLAADLAGLQPLDADLTAIAALSTAAYGRSLLTTANAAAARTLLGVTEGGSSGSERVVYASATATDDGSLAMDSVTFGADDTTALQALLDLAEDGPLRVVIDGKFSVSAALEVWGDTHIEALPGCGIISRNSADAPILTNKNRSISGAEITDENIVITGGIWNGNGANQEHDNETEGWITPLRFHGVKGLVVRDVLIRKPRTFALWAGNLDGFTFDNVRIDVGAGSGFNYDGIHVNGPARLGRVTNLVVKSMDDGLAFNADDANAQNDGSGSFEPYQSFGAITDVVVDGILFDNSNWGMRLLSGASRIDRMLIQNCLGNVKNQFAILDNYTEDAADVSAAGDGNFGTITFRDIHVNVTEDGYKNAYIYLNAEIDALELHNVRRTDFSLANYPTLLCDSDTAAKTVLVNGYRGQTDGGLNVADQIKNTGSIRSLVVQNSQFFNGGAESDGFPIRNSGTIQQLQISNCLGFGFGGFSANTGTIVFSHADNNHMDALSGWTTAGGWTANSNTSLDCVVSQQINVAYRGADSFSGDVEMSSLFTLPNTSTAGSALLQFWVRGAAPLPWASGFSGYSVIVSTEGAQITKQLAGVFSAQTAVGALTIATQYELILIAKTVGGNAEITGKIRRVSDSNWLTSAGAWNASEQAFDTWTDSSSPVLGAGLTGLTVYEAVASADTYEIRDYTVSAAP